MIKKVKALIKMDIQGIISSEYSLMLCDVYSKLFLNGGRPGHCVKSLKLYHQQLIQFGMKKAENFENKTCICNRKGLIFPSGLGRAINLETITDKDATLLIEMKVLKESDFETLPEGYQLSISKTKKETQEVIKKTYPEKKKNYKRKK